MVLPFQILLYFFLFIESHLCLSSDETLTSLDTTQDSYSLNQLLGEHFYVNGIRVPLQEEGCSAPFDLTLLKPQFNSFLLPNNKLMQEYWKGQLTTLAVLIRPDMLDSESIHLASFGITLEVDLLTMITSNSFSGKTKLGELHGRTMLLIYEWKPLNKPIFSWCVRFVLNVPNENHEDELPEIPEERRKLEENKETYLPIFFLKEFSGTTMDGNTLIGLRPEPWRNTREVKDILLPKKLDMTDRISSIKQLFIKSVRETNDSEVTDVSKNGSKSHLKEEEIIDIEHKKKENSKLPKEEYDKENEEDLKSENDKKSDHVDSDNSQKKENDRRTNFSNQGPDDDDKKEQTNENLQPDSAEKEKGHEKESEKSGLPDSTEEEQNDDEESEESGFPNLDENEKTDIEKSDDKNDEDSEENSIPGPDDEKESDDSDEEESEKSGLPDSTEKEQNDDKESEEGGFPNLDEEEHADIAENDHDRNKKRDEIVLPGPDDEKHTDIANSDNDDDQPKFVVEMKRDKGKSRDYDVTFDHVDETHKQESQGSQGSMEGKKRIQDIPRVESQQRNQEHIFKKPPEQPKNEGDMSNPRKEEDSEFRKAPKPMEREKNLLNQVPEDEFHKNHHGSKPILPGQVKKGKAKVRPNKKQDEKDERFLEPFQPTLTSQQTEEHPKQVPILRACKLTRCDQGVCFKTIHSFPCESIKHQEEALVPSKLNDNKDHTKKDVLQTTKLIHSLSSTTKISCSFIFLYLFIFLFFGNVEMKTKLF
ncbi:hypothetical protein HMI55_000900 [Coelomomyces lativittatus]|nr:hypothetical protein HMI55_000900 [Coelomomyces lativittatus]